MLSIEISLKKLWEKFRGHGRIGPHKSASGLCFAVDASFCALVPNPGNVNDNHLFPPWLH